MKHLTLFLLAALMLVLSAPLASAQIPDRAFCENGTCTYTSLEPLPLPGGGVVDASTFPSYVASAFQLLLASAGAIAVVMLVIGALTYMFSDVVGTKTKALERIRGAMWGVLLLVSSYLILNTINPDLVTFRFGVGPVTQNNPANSQLTANQAGGTSGGGPLENTWVKSGSATIGDLTGGDSAQKLREFNGQCNNKGGVVLQVSGNANATNYECIVPRYMP